MTFSMVSTADFGRVIVPSLLRSNPPSELNVSLYRAIDAFPIDAGGMVLLHAQSVEQGITQPEVKIRLSELRQTLLTC